VTKGCCLWEGAGLNSTNCSNACLIGAEKKNIWCSWGCCKADDGCTGCTWTP
jgi:hypothetical protein